jgi:hypothetical protein
MDAGSKGLVTVMLNTVEGIKYRVVSGDLLFQVVTGTDREGRRTSVIKNIVIIVLILIVVCEALTIRSDEYGLRKMAEDHGNPHLEIEGDSRRAVMIKNENYDGSDVRELIDHLASWQYEEPK